MPRIIHQLRSLATHDVLLKVFDALMLCVIFAAPLLMGGRHAIGRFVYVIFVVGLTITWSAVQAVSDKPKWRVSRVEPLLIAALLLVALQLVPLPTSWLGFLSPQISEDLPFWTVESAQRLGTWKWLSLTPIATREGLAVFGAHLLLFTLTLQRLSRIEDVERLLRWIALAAIFMSVLGLAQYLASNGKFLWVYVHPSRNTFSAVKGPFANENHFVHFITLGIGPLIWWLASSISVATNQEKGGVFLGLRGSDRLDTIRRLALPFGVGIVAFAALLTYSRGGLLVMLLAVGAAVLLQASVGAMSKKVVSILAGATLIVSVAVFIHGRTSLTRELDSITAGSIESLDKNQGRRKIWNANLAAISRYPALGTGVGSHREVYPTYFRHPSEVEYTHAESGYLQILVETGVPGLALLTAFIVVGIFWSGSTFAYAESNRITHCASAVLPGLFASVLHSVFDFPWYIPACLSLTAMLCACNCRLSQLAKRSHARRSNTLQFAKPFWVGASMMATVLAIMLAATLYGPARAAPHWDRYLMASLATRDLSPYRGIEHSQTAQYRSFIAATKSMKRHLDEVLNHNGNDHRASLRMAAMCMRLFDHYQYHSDNAMSLAQIRDAALTANFASRQAMDGWLSRAIGQNRQWLDLAARHALRSLELCPLQGEGYVYLAELAFLKGQGDVNQAGYLDQALRVRPFNGAVLFAAGREAALMGRPSLALDFWKHAFHQDIDQRKAIVSLLAPQMPAKFLLTHFEPDMAGTRLLFEQYRELGQDDQARNVGIVFAQSLEKGATEAAGMHAVDLLQQAQTVHKYLGNHDLALECARKAVQTAPNNFNLRYTLAHALYEQKRYDEAHEQLKWCTLRKPNDVRLRRLLQNVRKYNRQTNLTADSGTDQPRHR